MISTDPAFLPFAEVIRDRALHFQGNKLMIESEFGSLANWANAHSYYGLHWVPERQGWVFREWAPGARAIYFTGDFNLWDRLSHPMTCLDGQNWEIYLDATNGGQFLKHGSRFKLIIHSVMGVNDRLPAYATRAVQDPKNSDFAAQVWAPESPYIWKHTFQRDTNLPPLIYEAHTGMAQHYEGIGSYAEFENNMLPRIKALGFNTLQLMAIQEHPYYGSYGYHVANFFAASSRFGTPDELKSLIDAAHGMGLTVIMDVIHSHAVKNLYEGLNLFDGTEYQYFLPGPAGDHPFWDSKIFNYGKSEVLRFLLSNLRYWLDEFKMDGFRFDGVTSMLYHHHGENHDFSDVNDYFGPEVNHDAYLYMQLANALCKELRADSLTIAEDVSGMPGLGSPALEGGLGFDYRLGMGLPEYWVKEVKHTPDEQWSMTQMWAEMNNRYAHTPTIAYVESHDQALVGDQTLIFRLIGSKMYDAMMVTPKDLQVDRGIALYKLIYLLTASAGGSGYLNFMGNEIGHPEWIDFPRDGNNWSYAYARRQWYLADNPNLRYQYIQAFSTAMMQLLAQYEVMAEPYGHLLLLHDEMQVLAYRRGGLVWCFNFSPSASYPSLSIPTDQAAKYTIVLSTDDPRYDGFGITDLSTEHFSDEHGNIQIYLPSRTAVVLSGE